MTRLHGFDVNWFIVTVFYYNKHDKTRLKEWFAPLNPMSSACIAWSRNVCVMCVLVLVFCPNDSLCGSRSK